MTQNHLPEEMKTPMGCIGTMFTVIGMVVLATIWRGYVLTVLWGWFIVHAFKAEPLAISTAAGISLILHMLIPRGGMNEEKKKMKRDFTSWLIKASMQVILDPVIALLIGWIIVLFRGG